MEINISLTYNYLHNIYICFFNVISHKNMDCCNFIHNHLAFKCKSLIFRIL